MYSMLTAVCLLLFVSIANGDRRIEMNRIETLVFDKRSIAHKANGEEVPTLKCLEDRRVLCGVAKITCGLEITKQITSSDRWVCYLSIERFIANLEMPVTVAWSDTKVVLEGFLTDTHSFTKLNVSIECDRADNELSIWSESCSARYNVQKNTSASNHSDVMVIALLAFLCGWILRGSSKEDVQLKWTEYERIADRVTKELMQRKNRSKTIKDEEKGLIDLSDEDNNEEARPKYKFIDVTEDVQRESIKHD
jgi:hypothetical protein